MLSFFLQGRKVRKATVALRVRQELLVTLEIQVPKDRVDAKVVEDLQV